jgi:hypothetical protein
MTTNISAELRARSLHALSLLSFAMAAFLGLAVAPALAQITSTWMGGSGNWSPCPNQGGTALWDTCNNNPPQYPDGNFNAVIPPGNGPVYATGASVVNLSLGSGGTLNLFGTTYVDITGSSIANNGSIVMTSGNGLFIQAPATVTLSGSGSVMMNDPGTRFWGGNGSGAALINQETIQGEEGLGVGGGGHHQSRHD